MGNFPLIITISDAEVTIDVLLEDDNMEDDRNPTGGGGSSLSRPHQFDRKQLRHMNNILVGLRQDGSDLRSEFARVHERHTRFITVVNRNITHMKRNPVCRIQRHLDVQAMDNDVMEGEYLE